MNMIITKQGVDECNYNSRTATCRMQMYTGALLAT